MNVEGRVALITGAAGGIGLAIGAALHAAGARVVLTDIDDAELERAVARLGANAAGFVLDVSQLEPWTAARRFAESAFGPVDILVNNAGLGPDGFELAEMKPEVFDRTVRTKLHGTFHGISTFAAGMRERGAGHIVNTASMAGVMVGERLGAYTAAMFAVVGMSEVLRLELAPAVGVSVLCPGLVTTRLRETTAAAGIERREAGTAMPASAIDPKIIGALVVEGIRANQLYLFSHGEYRDVVAARAERLLAAFVDVPRRTASTSTLPGTEGHTTS